jgi:hypothetical protein
VVGEWRGQTQYQGAENGQLIQDAHSVVLLTLTFTDDGKVSGFSPENGCRVLGIWSPGVTPRLFPLDITLSSCRYEGFNRRYTGQLTATFEKLSGQLLLMVYTIPLPGVPVGRYAMRRPEPRWTHRDERRQLKEEIGQDIRSPLSRGLFASGPL